MKKRHLRLVTSPCQKTEKVGLHSRLLRFLKNGLDKIFITKDEKIYVLKTILIKIYRDYEKTTGYIDIPYFVRAEIQMSKIIRERKINYYYNRFKKLKNEQF